MSDVIRLLVGVADEARRPEATAALAAALGVDAVVLLVRDPEAADSLLPAPGFP